jgi:hypothetical protein
VLYPRAPPADGLANRLKSREGNPLVKTRIARLARTAGVAAIASLAVAAPASAASSGCSAPPVSQAFLPWGDQNDYFLAQGGDFESTSGWTFSGGARLVSGSEPFVATGKPGKTSLSMPTGGVALSPVLCLTPDNPSIRFFAKAAQGDAASLRGEAVVTKPSAQVIGLGAVNGTLAWSPVEPMASGVNNVLWNADKKVSLQIRFTADSGNWQIDDLFVDPQKRG